MIDYAAPGPLTSIDGIDAALLEPVAGHPVEICMPAHTLVIQPGDAQSIGLPSERFAENQMRPVTAIVQALLVLDPAPLSVPREPEKRVIGSCRHFAVLSCALLRYRGIPARVRCGFATYFQPNQALDHWITEYWDRERDRWIRVDSEVLGQSVLSHPEELHPDDFLSGGEAWTAFRRGEIEASHFGVYGTENWGAAEIRGNAVKDLAALNKVEMLPWDEWGRMEEAYKGETGAEYDELLDVLAAVCAGDDPQAVSALYARDELKVPTPLIR
jgi:hypothetical protein